MDPVIRPDEPCTDPAQPHSLLFLGRAFRYPDAGLARILEAWAREVDGDAGEAGVVGRWVGERARSGDLLPALAADYTGLFVNAHPRLPAPPYAANRLDPMNPAAVLVELGADLDALGLDALDGERKDHVSSLVLAAGALAARGDGEACMGFARRWLVPWCGQLATQVAGAAIGPFYPAMARWLEAELAQAGTDDPGEDGPQEKGDEP